MNWVEEHRLPTDTDLVEPRNLHSFISCTQQPKTVGLQARGRDDLTRRHATPLHYTSRLAHDIVKWEQGNPSMTKGTVHGLLSLTRSSRFFHRLVNSHDSAIALLLVLFVQLLQSGPEELGLCQLVRLGFRARRPRVVRKVPARVRGAILRRGLRGGAAQLPA